MDVEGRKPDNTLAVINLNEESHVIVAQGGGVYEHNALDGDIFYAANQTATTWSVALNTTHTGLVVYNPVTSNKNIVIIKVGFALSVAPVGIASIGLFGGYSGTGILTHTTPLTPASTTIGRPTGYGGADAAATLVGTPTWLMPMMGGFTAGALPSTSMSVVDIGGSIIVPPGAYCGIGALTAVVGFGAIFWKEISI